MWIQVSLSLFWNYKVTLFESKKCISNDTKSEMTYEHQYELEKVFYCCCHITPILINLSKPFYSLIRTVHIYITKYKLLNSTEWMYYIRIDIYVQIPFSYDIFDFFVDTQYSILHSQSFLNRISFFTFLSIFYELPIEISSLFTSDFTH